MLVAVDVGNSGVKAGLFEGDELLHAVRLTAGEDLRERLRLPEDADPDVVAVSVSEPALAALRADLGRAGLAGRLVVLGVDVPLLVPNRYRDPAEVGRDRLVAAAAARELAGGAAVVVDAGSAVTVDAVAADGAFLGGSIAPGRRAMTLGLAAAAPALPPVPADDAPAGLPRSTCEALAAGTTLGLAGLVDRLVRLAADELGRAGEPGPAVIVTGGDGDRLAPLLEREVVVEPWLTLRGVRLLHGRAGEGRCT